MEEKDLQNLGEEDAGVKAPEPGAEPLPEEPETKGASSGESSEVAGAEAPGE